MLKPQDLHDGDRRGDRGRDGAPHKRKAIVAFSNTHPDTSHSTLSGGGVGAADIARHLLRPGIPLGG
jgi:hypothetical protein